jgi:hypothetical protein
MNFSGTDGLCKKRNFYTQYNNFSFVWNGYFDSVTGIYHFGVTGSGGQIDFQFNSGLIYTQDNYLIGSYQPYNQFMFQVDFSSGNYNITKDGTPLIYGENKSTGLFDNFYIKRSDSGINTYFDLTISGDDAPVYSITNFGYLFGTGVEVVTGYFYNLGNFPINIFQSQALPPQPIGYVPLSGIINNSGLFLFTGDFTNFNFNSPIIVDFSTNFNQVFVNFNIVNTATLSNFIFLQEGITFNFGNTGLITQTIPYQCFSGNTIANYPANLYFSLKTVTGTGIFTQNNFNTGSIYYLTTGYGNFLQSGLLTGIYTFPTGNIFGLTGVFEIIANTFAWATGAATGAFSGFGTGIGTGINYTGIAYGAFTGLVTGEIYNGSGTLLYSGQATGINLNCISVNYTGYVNATGYINIHNLHYEDYFYIGNLFNPLVKGTQFFNETGLVYYLSGNTNVYNVKGYYDAISTNIYLEALSSGTLGNGLPVISGNCDQGSFLSSQFLTGGVNIGNTGLSLIAVSNWTGNIVDVITGSGNYNNILSGFSTGLFVYTKTFTGNWDLLTGLSSTSLVSLKRPGNYDDNTISGSGLFPPNQSVTIQIINTLDLVNQQTANLIISGYQVIDPYNVNLTN